MSQIKTDGAREAFSNETIHSVSARVLTPKKRGTTVRKKKKAEAAVKKLAQKKARPPRLRSLDDINLAEVFDEFSEHARSVSPENYSRNLRRYNQEFVRRFPKSVSPRRKSNKQ